MFNRLASAQSQFDGVSRAPEDMSPFRHRLLFTAIGDLLHLACVVRLLCRRGPPHVAGLIPARIVDAIQRHPRRAISEVAVKGLEAIPPLITYRDAAASPQVELGIRRIEASIFHVGPGRVGARPAFSMRGRLNGKPLFVEASARCSASREKFVGDDQRLLSTVALADPFRYRSPVGVAAALATTLHKQPPKSAPGKINEGTHDDL